MSNEGEEWKGEASDDDLLLNGDPTAEQPKGILYGRDLVYGCYDAQGGFAAMCDGCKQLVNFDRAEDLLDHLTQCGML